MPASCREALTRSSRLGAVFPGQRSGLHLGALAEHKFGRAVEYEVVHSSLISDLYLIPALLQNAFEGGIKSALKEASKVL